MIAADEVLSRVWGMLIGREGAPLRRYCRDDRVIRNPVFRVARCTARFQSQYSTIWVNSN